MLIFILMLLSTIVLVGYQCNNFVKIWGHYSSTVDIPIKVTSDGGMINVSESQNAIHEGNHFYVKKWIDVDGDQTVNMLMFITPSLTKIHARASVASEAEFTVGIYEGITTSSNGVLVDSINNYRDSTFTPELIAYMAPTVTSFGDLIWSGKVGSGKDATVSLSTGYGIVVKANTKYLFVFTKEVANVHWIDSDFWWFEEKL